MESITKSSPCAGLSWPAGDSQTRQAALHVVLHKRQYVFPWSRFIYAEGSNDEVIISFPTHEVLVTGYGLDHLLADIASQSLVSLREPHRPDKFRAAGEPEPAAAIETLVVRQVTDEE